MTKGNDKRKKGQRPRVFVCVGMKDSKLIKQRIYFCANGQQEGREPGIWAQPAADEKAEAIALFKATYGFEPEIVDGPNFDVLGNAAAVQSERLSVSIKVSDLRYTQMRWQAEIMGFKVAANGISACSSKDGKEKFKDNELVCLYFDDDQDVRDENGKKLSKPRLGNPAVVRLSSLENVQEIAQV